MNKTYKFFRTYCLIAITVLFILLFSVGICTAKFQTDETVFKATYSTARMFASEKNVTVNLGGKIISFMPQTVIFVFERARPILLAPINNVIELIKQIADLV